MKKRNILAAIGLSLAGLGMAVSPARALTYSNDDLLLAFYASGGDGASTSIVVNIGQASTYRNASGEFFLTVGSLKTDLQNAFGDDWATRNDVHWGVFGSTMSASAGGDGAWTLYGTRAQTTVGTKAQAYNLGSVPTQSVPANKIGDLGGAYAATGTQSGLTAGANSYVSLQESLASNDFAGYQGNDGALSFGYFNGALADFTNGVAGSAADLFRMPTGTSTTKGTYAGTFTVGVDGVVRYSVVPNPSPTPVATPAPTPNADVVKDVASATAKKVVVLKKQISRTKKLLKAAKKITDPAKKKAQLKKLKAKLKKLKKKLKSL